MDRRRRRRRRGRTPAKGRVLSGEGGKGATLRQRHRLQRAVTAASEGGSVIVEKQKEGSRQVMAMLARKGKGRYGRPAGAEESSFRGENITSNL